MDDGEIELGIKRTLREIAESISPGLYEQVSEMTALSERENNAARFMKGRVDAARNDLSNAKMCIKLFMCTLPPKAQLTILEQAEKKRKKLREILEQNDRHQRRQAYTELMERIEIVETRARIIMNGDPDKKEAIRSLEDLRRSVKRMCPSKYTISSVLTKYREIMSGIRNRGSRATVSIVDKASRRSAKDFEAVPSAETLPWTEVVPYDSLPEKLRGYFVNEKTPVLVNSEDENKGVPVGHEFPVSLFLHRNYSLEESVLTKINIDPRHLKVLNTKSNQVKFRFPKGAEYLACHFLVRAKGPAHRNDWVDASQDKDLGGMVESGRYLPGSFSTSVEMISSKDSKNYKVSMPVPILENCGSAV